MTCKEKITYRQDAVLAVKFTHEYSRHWNRPIPARGRRRRVGGGSNVAGSTSGKCRPGEGRNI